MKLKYEKPMIEIDDYELDASIASNCKVVVDMGPKYGSHDPCKSYYDHSGEPWPDPNAINLMSNYNIDFWENCDCYTSASGLYFTS